MSATTSGGLRPGDHGPAWDVSEQRSSPRRRVQLQGELTAGGIVSVKFMRYSSEVDDYEPFGAAFDAYCFIRSFQSNYDAEDPPRALVEYWPDSHRWEIYQLEC